MPDFNGLDFNDDSACLAELSEFVKIPSVSRDADAPTIVVYGHYDVQPTGDLAD